MQGFVLGTEAAVLQRNVALWCHYRLPSPPWKHRRAWRWIGSWRGLVIDIVIALVVAT